MDTQVRKHKQTSTQSCSKHLKRGRARARASADDGSLCPERSRGAGSNPHFLFQQVDSLHTTFAYQQFAHHFCIPPAGIKSVDCVGRSRGGLTHGHTGAQTQADFNPKL